MPDRRMRHILRRLRPRALRASQRHLRSLGRAGQQCRHDRRGVEQDRGALAEGLPVGNGYQRRGHVHGLALLPPAIAEQRGRGEDAGEHHEHFGTHEPWRVRVLDE